METPSDRVSLDRDVSRRVDVNELARFRERVQLMIDSAIARLSATDDGASWKEEVLTEFVSAMRMPHPVRPSRIAPLLATVDAHRATESETDVDAERLLLLLATQRSIRLHAVQRLPASVQLQLMSYWLMVVAPPKRTAELFRRGSNTFESACETAVLERVPAGQLSWVRSGLPRRSVLDLSLANTLPFISTLLLDMRGFGPACYTHANTFRRNRFIMLEIEARRSYWRIAQAMRDEPDIKGLVTVSWYHDPDLPRVSPHLSWMNAIVQEGGGRIFSGAIADNQSGTFENSSARQAAAVRGDYQPREGIVLWPRNAMLAWADRQTDLDDDAIVAQRLTESLDALESTGESPRP